MPCVEVWHSPETLLPGSYGWCLLSSHLHWGCTSLVQPGGGWGGAVMESLPFASGSATKLSPARVRSCSAGMMLRIRPCRIFPLSCTLPFPSLPGARAQHGHGGTLYIGSAWWGAEGAQRTHGSAGAAGALVPLPAAPVFPSTLRESAWGPFATPGSWYLLLLSFFKKKK